MSKRKIVKLFESRKGQMNNLLHRDFINNGIATLPVKISSYDDVIHPLSVRRYETLNPDFNELVELGAGVIPSDCPIVLNIIEDCLTEEEQKIIVATIQEYYAYKLGVVENEEKRHTKTLVFHGTYNTGTVMEIGNLPQGFNLVGNPFVVDAYANRTYYKMNAAGDDIVVVENYAENPIPACTGVVVKAETAGESVTFSTEVPQPSANNGNLQMSLINSGAKSDPFQDKAILSFNESDKLEKFIFNERRAKLYIPQNGNDYAIAYSESQGEVPLYFEAKENGEFSLTVNPEGVDMLYLHLIDNMTAADIDLLQTPTYTFTAKTSDYASRFRLIFAAQFSVGDEVAGQPFAFFSNGNWIIPNEGKATLQVIDLNGRILSSETINGCVSKAINGAAGIYILRLIDGKEVRTQKIVIQ